MIVIEVELETVAGFNDAHHFIRAYDLYEWTIGGHGAVLIVFTPFGCCDKGNPGWPFAEGLLVTEQHVQAQEIQAFDKARGGILPWGTVPGAPDELKLVRLMGTGLKCAGDAFPPRPIETCFDGPDCPEEKQASLPLDFDSVLPSEMKTTLARLFNNAEKYVENHFHYAHLDKLVEPDDFEPTPALPRYTKTVDRSKITHVAGINRPYLYIAPSGTRSAFATHIEDVGLPSVNTLFMGEPKVWMTVAPFDEGITTAKLMGKCSLPLFPPSDTTTDRLLSAEFVNTKMLDNHKPGCSQALRGAHLMMTPDLLDAIGVSYSYIVQRPGQMVYTSGRTLHCGFNMGGNLAGSLNLEGAGPSGLGCVCRFDAEVEKGQKAKLKVPNGINGSTVFVER